MENSHACYDRLKPLILLIAIAYTCAIIQGHTIKQMGIQKYVGRVQDNGRAVRRHSSFWIGLYGECWVTGSEICQDLVTELMRIRSNKRPFFQKGIRARTLILSTL